MKFERGRGRGCESGEGRRAKRSAREKISGEPVAWKERNQVVRFVSCGDRILPTDLRAGLAINRGKR